MWWNIPFVLSASGTFWVRDSLVLNTLQLFNEDLVLSNATAISNIIIQELNSKKYFCLHRLVCVWKVVPIVCACSAGVLSCVDELNVSTPLAYRCGHNCLIYCEVTLHCNMITWLLDVSGWHEILLKLETCWILTVPVVPRTVSIPFGTRVDQICSGTFFLWLYVCVFFLFTY